MVDKISWDVVAFKELTQLPLDKMAAILQTIYSEFRCILMNEKFCILIKTSLKFVFRGPIYNNPALV